MTRRTYIILSFITFTMGIGIVKFFPMQPFIRGFGGDFLVVIFIYCIVKSVFPFMKPLSAATGVFLLSVTIEILQYFHLTDLLNIKNRITQIILGSTFDLMDIVAYLSGLLFFLVMEHITKNPERDGA